MTMISANSIALDILKQPSTAPWTNQTEAADKILDIISRRQPTTTKAADNISGLAAETVNVGNAAKVNSPLPTNVNSQLPTNVPTVSSAIPKVTMSAMNAAAANMMSSYYVNPIEYTVENAESLVRELITMATRASPRYVREIIVPQRDEYNTQYAEWGVKRIANGEDEAVVKKQVEYFTSDRAYEARVELAALNNSLNGSYCKVSREYMHYNDRALKYFFGSAIVLEFGENSQVSVTPGILYYKNGQKMVEYKENGELEIFDANGNITKQYKKSELQSY